MGKKIRKCIELNSINTHSKVDNQKTASGLTLSCDLHSSPLLANVILFSEIFIGACMIEINKPIYPDLFRKCSEINLS